MYYDTHTMTINQDNLCFPSGKEFNWSEEDVAFVINYAVENSDMEFETPLSFKNFGVSEIVKDIIYSKVAYIEDENRNIGYFIISVDMMEHINVTFSRWD